MVVPLAFLALPGLDLDCRVLEHLPAIFCNHSNPLPALQASLTIVAGRSCRRCLALACGAQGRLAEQAPWPVPDPVRGGQLSPKVTLLGSGRGPFPVFQEALMH